MNKKFITILSIAACIIFSISIFYVVNYSLDYEKTVVVDDRADAEILNNANFDAVKDVKLQGLPEAASVFDTHQLQLWCNDKLLLTHINPLFKFDENMNLVRDLSSPFSPYQNPKTDFSKNALYLMNPDDGKLEQLTETNPYNIVRCYLSPDRTKMLVYESYNIIGEEGVKDASQIESDSAPFTIDGYGNLKSRIRMYDFKTKRFSIIDEWDTKYLVDKNEYGAAGLYNTFGDLSWSMDGNGIVYCEKTAADEYKFKVFTLDNYNEIEYIVRESEGRFERVFLHAISKDLKQVWFSGVSGFMAGSLGFDLEGAKSSIYLLDLNKLENGAQELVKNMVFTRVLNDENTIIYASEPNVSDSTFKLYQYDMSQKQNKLIDENVYAEFEVSKDGRTLAYLSSDGIGFELNMIGINPGTETEKIVLYKSGPESYIVNGLSWSNDDSKVAVSYYKNNGMLNSSGQLCVLTLKKD